MIVLPIADGPNVAAAPTGDETITYDEDIVVAADDTIPYPETAGTAEEAAPEN